MQCAASTFYNTKESVKLLSVSTSVQLTHTSLRVDNPGHVSITGLHSFWRVNIEEKKKFNLKSTLTSIFFFWIVGAEELWRNAVRMQRGHAIRGLAVTVCVAPFHSFSEFFLNHVWLSRSCLWWQLQRDSSWVNSSWNYLSTVNVRCFLTACLRLMLMILVWLSKLKKPPRGPGDMWPDVKQKQQAENFSLTFSETLGAKQGSVEGKIYLDFLTSLYER